MTEQEWLASTLIRDLGHGIGSMGSHRKRILFACACCRLVWHLLPDLCHRLVEAVERYADNETSPGDLVALFDGYHPHQVSLSAVPGGSQAAGAIDYLGWRWRWRTNPTGDQDGSTVYQVARSAAESLAKSMQWEKARELEGELVRDIFNPFRPASLGPVWLSWNDGTIPKLAQAIYHDRAFDHLPILADALEEAGCTNADILEHCRAPAPHARGCWLLDLLLDRS